MKLLVILFAILIALAIIGVAAYFAYRYAVSSPYHISSAEAKELLQTDQIDLMLDVRTDLERRTLGYYPGSVHIQSADLEARMPKEYPDKRIRILAYCNTGHRARMATDKLHKLGYTNARYISSSYTSLQ
jgi:rhodanese-related sulfurtransferase